MNRIAIICLAASLVTGCSTIRDSRANPMNWFGGATTTAADDSLIPTESAIARSRKATPYAGVPIAQLQSAALRDAIGGKILEVQALSATLGAADLRFIDVPNDDPRLREFRLHAVMPYRAPVGTVAARSVAAAQFLTDQDLAGLTKIIVTSATNSITLRP